MRTGKVPWGRTEISPTRGPNGPGESAVRPCRAGVGARDGEHMTNKVEYGAIIAAVDGSRHSDVALDWAMRQAETENRALVIVHAAGELSLRSLGARADEARRELRIHGRRVTDRALGQVRKHNRDLDVRVTMKLGDPVSVLLGMSDSAYVMVLGSRGRGSIGSMLLGSVSAEVSAKARCPVVVVRRTEEPAADRIIVGVDDSEISTAAVDFAFSEASWTHRPVTVIHANPLERWSDWDRLPGQAASDGQLLLAEAVAGYAEKYPDVMQSVRVIQGEPAPVLVRESLSASMVVVGSRGRGPAKALLLGSTSRYVVEHAHCTVAVAR